MRTAVVDERLEQRLAEAERRFAQLDKELVDPAVPGGMPATMMTVSPAWAKCLRWRRSSTCATISSVCRTSGTS